MASGVKYYCFVQDLGRKVHNLHTDTLKIALTNTAPNVSTHTGLASITEIGAGNGYSAGGATVGSTSFAQTSGTAKLAGNDVTITASGGTIGPFQYWVLYNDTAASDQLIAYWDRGAALTLQNGESWTSDFSDNTALVTIA